MKRKINIGGFIKIGKKANIEILQKEGLVYSNTVKYFREIEKDELRKDNREGSVNHILFDENSFLSIQLENNQEIPYSMKSGHLNEYDSNIDLTHIFCLYFFKLDDATGEPFIDPKNMKFGNEALLITDPKEFINRIQESTKSDFRTEYRPVNYFEESKSHKTLTVFDKPSYFRYQKEFRFHFLKVDPAPLKIRIGSIEDISERLEANKLSMLRIKYDNER